VTMTFKHLICPEKRRRLPKSFSWLDHRLARSGQLNKCSSEALALYLFLVIVGDADGLSYYSDATLCSRLPLTTEKLPAARKNLIRVGLIAYQAPLYQVLNLDAMPSNNQGRKRKNLSSSRSDFPRSGSGRPQSIEDILKTLLPRDPS